MASSSNTLKVLACAVLLLSTVSHGRSEPGDRRPVLIVTGRKMMVEEVTVTAVGMPRLTRAAAAAAAAGAYSESKRSSPGGPDPQHH
ncbi:unnamed protein product [Urochloa decumbens]|uniref:Uncharacterized protein n=1 Tax=Urochloa decumbens TaxID=240449 RepID=A0ABC9DSZ5_9POAL